MTVNKPLKKTFATQSKLVQNALIQCKVFEQTIKIMGDTIEDMDIEKEEKVKKNWFFGKKIVLPDCKVIEELNKLVLKKHQIKEKVIGIWIE